MDMYVIDPKTHLHSSLKLLINSSTRYNGAFVSAQTCLNKLSHVPHV